MKITPKEFTILEGGEWMPWVFGSFEEDTLESQVGQLIFDLPMASAYPDGKYMEFFSIRLEDGRLWDCVFGWRPTESTLNIGCGKHPILQPDVLNLDCVPFDGVDCIHDLEQVPLPFPDDTFSTILAFHILEHIHNYLPLMQELWRVAKPGAVLEVRVPHGANDMAWDDPQHVRAFSPGAWQFLAQSAYQRADYGYRGDWICERVELIVPKEIATSFQSREDCEWAAFHARNVVGEMRARLIANKPARTPESAPEHQPEIAVLVAIPQEPGNA